MICNSFPLTLSERHPMKNLFRLPSLPTWIGISAREHRAAMLAVAAAMATTLTASAREAVTYLESVESAGSSAANGSFVHLADVLPEGDWKIAVDFSLDDITANHAIFTCKNNSAGNRVIGVYNIKNSGIRLDVNNVVGTAENGGLASGTFPTPGLRQTIVYDAGDLYLDGVRIASFKDGVENVTGANVNPITIFGDRRTASDWTNYSKGRLYGVTMWDGAGNLVHNLRPCRDADGVAGLYDDVTGNKYLSVATTPFTAGLEAAPEGVEFLESITTSASSNAKNDGQFFNTEYVPAYDCKIELDVAPLSATNRNWCFFHSATPSSSSYYKLSLFHISSTTKLRLDTGTTTTAATDKSKRGIRRTYVFDRGAVFVDGEKQIDNASGIASIATAPSLPLVIGASYDGGANNAPSNPSGNVSNFSSMRIYRFRLWDGSGILQRDMRPAKDAAGNVALYDVVNRRFHYPSYRTTSALAAVGGVDGNFPVGPELDYLETAGNVDDGRQWYDTGYIPSGLAKIEIDAKPLTAVSTQYTWFSTKSSGNELNVFSIKDKGLRLDVNNVQGQLNAKPSKDTRYTLLYNGGNLYLGNDLLVDRSNDAAAMASAKWRTYLFASSGGATSKDLFNMAKIQAYGVRIWDSDGGTLVRDFVPRRTASGFVGLYDNVGDKFYKSGNDVVTNGRDVSAIAGTDNAPTAAQIEAAGDVLSSAVLAKGGSKIAAAGGFAEKTEENVVCPFAGRTTTVHCATFPQSFTIAADGEGTNVVTATTGFASLGKPFTSAEGTSWTAVLRVRREAKGVDVADTVLSLGSDCAKDGLEIGFCGSEANRRLDVRVGGEVWPGLSGFLAPAGDWLDIAVSVDASTGAVRVYYCREGQSVIWADKTFAASATSETLVNLAARATWSVKVGGEAAVSNAKVGRIVDGKWTMFDDALKAFKGSVESVALWSRKLTDAEVLAAFNTVPHIDAFMMIVR